MRLMPGSSQEPARRPVDDDVIDFRQEGMAMTETEERTIHDLTVRIDRGLCVGYGHCVDESEEAFRLDDDDQAAFRSPERVPREELMEACRACPVQALTVFDREGSRIVPE